MRKHFLEAGVKYPVRQIIIPLASSIPIALLCGIVLNLTNWPYVAEATIGFFIGGICAGVLAYKSPQWLIGE